MLTEEEKEYLLKSAYANRNKNPYTDFNADPQAAEQDSSFFDAIKRGGVSGGLGVIQGQAQLGNIFGIGDGATANALEDVMQQNNRKKSYTIGEMLPFASDYWTNPEGATYDVANMLGSSAVLGGETAAVVGTAGAAGLGGAGAVGVLGKMASGLSTAAKARGWAQTAKILDSKLGQAYLLNVLKTPMEIASEGGNAGADVLANGGSLSDARNAALLDMAIQGPLLGLSNTVESLNLGKAFTEFGGKHKFMKAVGGLTKEALQNGWEEGMQQTAGEYAKGETDRLTNVVNPFAWSDEALQQAAAGAVGGLAIGGGNIGARAVFGDKEQAEQSAEQAEQPQENKLAKIFGLAGVLQPTQEEQLASAMGQDYESSNAYNEELIANNQRIAREKQEKEKQFSELLTSQAEAQENYDEIADIVNAGKENLPAVVKETAQQQREIPLLGEDNTEQLEQNIIRDFKDNPVAFDNEVEDLREMLEEAVTVGRITPQAYQYNLAKLAKIYHNVRGKLGNGVIYQDGSEKPAVQMLGEGKPFVGNYKSWKIADVANKTDKELKELAQQVKNYDNSDQMKQAVISEAKKRGMKFGDNFEAYSFADLVPSQMNYPAQAQTPKDTHYQYPSTIHDTADLEQKLANKFMNNPQGLHNDYLNALALMKNYYTSGLISEEETRARLTELGQAYERVQKLTGNQVIYAGHEYNIQAEVKKARERFKRDKAKRDLRATNTENRFNQNIGDSGQRGKMEVERSAEISKESPTLLGAKKKVRKPFSAIARSTLFYRQREKLEKQRAELIEKARQQAELDRQEAEAEFEEEVQAVANDVWQTAPTRPISFLNEQIAQIKNDRKELLKPFAEDLNSRAKLGTYLILANHFEEKTQRVSNNELWYSKWSRHFGYRHWNMKAAYELAEDIFRGRDDFDTMLIPHFTFEGLTQSLMEEHNADRETAENMAREEIAELDEMYQSNSDTLDYLDRQVVVYEEAKERFRKDPNYGKEEYEREQRDNQNAESQQAQEAETANSNKEESEVNEQENNNFDNALLQQGSTDEIADIANTGKQEAESTGSEAGRADTEGDGRTNEEVNAIEDTANSIEDIANTPAKADTTEQDKPTEQPKEQTQATTPNQEERPSETQLEVAKDENKGYTFNRNEEKNGIEIKFDSKPDADVLQQLKDAGFRWSKYKKVWYASMDPEGKNYDKIQAVLNKMGYNEEVAGNISTKETAQAEEADHTKLTAAEQEELDAKRLTAQLGMELLKDSGFEVITDAEEFKREYGRSFGEEAADAVIQQQIITYREGDTPADLTPIQKMIAGWEKLGNMFQVAFVGEKPKDYVPKKVGKAYKLMEQWPDGTLHALFAGVDKPIELGVWNFAAGFSPDKGTNIKSMKLRPRYGWHMGTGVPATYHLMSAGGDLTNPKMGYYTKGSGHPTGTKRVWCEVFYDATQDFTDIALQNPSTKEKDIRGLVPFGGYYMFQEGNLSNWIIASAVKFNRVIPEAERQQILKDAGYNEDLVARTQKLPSLIKTQITNSKKKLDGRAEFAKGDTVESVQAYIDALEETLRKNEEYVREINDGKDWQYKKRTKEELVAERERIRKEVFDNPEAVQAMTTASGQVYGFVKDGKVYIDTELVKNNDFVAQAAETPIHEYVHLWDKVLQAANPALWKQGVELLKQSSLWQAVLDNPAYANIAGNEDLVASEVHAMLVGKDGANTLATLAKAHKDSKSLLLKLKEWLSKFWFALRDVFADNWSDSDIKKISIEDFKNMPLVDMANKVNLKEKLAEAENKKATENQSYEEVAKKAENIDKEDVFKVLDTLQAFRQGEENTVKDIYYSKVVESGLESWSKAEATRQSDKSEKATENAKAKLDTLFRFLDVTAGKYNADTRQLQELKEELTNKYYNTKKSSKAEQSESATNLKTQREQNEQKAVDGLQSIDKADAREMFDMLKRMQGERDDSKPNLGHSILISKLKEWDKAQAEYPDRNIHEDNYSMNETFERAFGSIETAAKHDEANSEKNLEEVSKLKERLRNKYFEGGKADNTVEETKPTSSTVHREISAWRREYVNNIKSDEVERKFYTAFGDWHTTNEKYRENATEQNRKEALDLLDETIEALEEAYKEAHPDDTKGLQELKAIHERGRAIYGDTLDTYVKKSADTSKIDTSNMASVEVQQKHMEFLTRVSRWYQKHINIGSLSAELIAPSKNAIESLYNAAGDYFGNQSEENLKALANTFEKTIETLAKNYDDITIVGNPNSIPNLYKLRDEGRKLYAEGEDNHVGNSRGLQDVSGGEVSEGLQADEEGRKSGQVLSGTNKSGQGNIQRDGGTVSSKTPNSGQRNVSSKSTMGERSDGVGEGDNQRDVIQLTPAQKKNAKPSEIAGHDYTIEGEVAEGGTVNKYNNNIAAIELLKRLEQEGRKATPAEQAVLAKYVGWGGISEIFKKPYQLDPQWRARQEALYKLLTEDEIEEARASTTTAFYTPIHVVESIWDTVKSLGFKGKKGERVMEPAIGVGNFFGAMPVDLRSKVALNGIEMDHISARIAQQLYQTANIQNSPYEQAISAENFFDLTITNVPFSTGIHPYDPKFNKPKFALHDYYINKMVEQTREGGLIVVITSKGTMDNSGKFRDYIANKANFIGAVRLPDTTFRKNANTDVTSDIIILQKLKKDEKPSELTKLFTTSDTINVEGKNVRINGYYIEHPEMMIGTPKLGNFDAAVWNGAGLDLEKEIKDRLATLPKNIYTQDVGKRKTTSEQATLESFKVPEGKKVNEYFRKDGKVYVVKSTGEAELLTEKESDQAIANKYIDLRDKVLELYQAQTNPDTTNEQLKQLRNQVRKLYNDFIDPSKSKYLHDYKNLLATDPQYGQVCAIEKYTPAVKEGNKILVKQSAKPATIQYKRTVDPVREVKTAGTSTDALALALSQHGEVDLAYMSELTGKDEKTIVDELQGVIFENPYNRSYETAEEYLSGNVREKLEQARIAAKTNSKYYANVDALEKVQPKDLVYTEINVGLGSTWVPTSDYQDFAVSLAGELRPTDIDAIKEKGYPLIIDYINGWGWRVDKNPNWGTSELNNFLFRIIRNYSIKEPDGSYKKNLTAVDLVECAINNRKKKFTKDGEKNGKPAKVADVEANTLVNQRLTEIRNKFKEWVWQDKSRRDRLVNYYNNNFNNEVLRKYDGSHLRGHLEGFNNTIKLRQHQLDAVWRILSSEGNTLLAHCVGAGKTWTMQTAAMEAKRLGIARKSMFVIPNHMLLQFENEFRTIYPNAKLLVIGSETLPDVTVPRKKGMTNADYAKAKSEKVALRNETLSQIAAEDWDGIIISHNMFKRIPLSAERVQAFYKKQSDELRAIREALASDKSAGSTVKDIEKTITNFENKMKEAANMEAKDVVIPFEQLGIDQIFVDEADMFKNLYFATKLSRISGISQSNSQRSMDMFMKTQYLTETFGRGVIFATGTPISNTMNEMFTMMRYLAMDMLKAHGMENFDPWISTFGNYETTYERSPEGEGFRETEKITSFLNFPELQKMFRTFADIKTQDELDLDIPKIRGGKPTVVEIANNDYLSRFIKETVKKRALKIRNGLDPHIDNMLKLTGDLRKASLDMRLVDPTCPAEAVNGKLKAVADNVFKEWQNSADTKGAQLVFCDLSTPKGVSDKVKEESDEAEENEQDEAEDKDNVTAYQEIKDMLIKRGIPAKDIAFIHDAKNKKQKQALFDKVNKGEIRVLIGSTEKMGAGTNCQKKLVALHDVDCPWRPRDIEQRHGRILRQGNENKEVAIYNYVTKDSFDANMWEKLKNKAMMINQAMSGNTTDRTIQDVGVDELTFGEIEAMASGNPLMAERTMLLGDVSKYSVLETNYYREQSINEIELENLPRITATAEAAMKGAKEDVKRRTDTTTGDNFRIKILNKTYTNFTDAKAAFEAYAKKFNDADGKIVGSFGGFDIQLRLVGKGEKYSDAQGKPITATADIVRATLVGSNKYECEPSVSGLQQAVKNGPEKVLAAAKELVEKSKDKEKTLQEAIKAPFQYASKLKEMRDRLTEINIELGIGYKYQKDEDGDQVMLVNTETGEVVKYLTNDEYDKIIKEKQGITEDTAQQSTDDNTQYSVNDNEDVIRSKRELVEEIEKSLEGVDVVDNGDGNTYTLNFPNGETLVFNIKEQILLTPEQAAAAGKAHNVNGVKQAEGSVTLNEAGGLTEEKVLGVLNLSQHSKVGAAFHEVIHIARKVSLTARENKDLERFYGKEAEKSGKDIEEVIAEGGRAWWLNKDHRFGKLWRKVKRFLASTLGIFKQSAEVDRIMEEIASGKVWKREFNLQKDSAAFANVVDHISEYKSSDMVDVMQTPLILKLVGAELLPVKMRVGELANSVLGKHREGQAGEGMNEDILKQIPRALTKPLMVIKSNYKGKQGEQRNVVVLNLKDKNNATIVVPFELNKKDGEYLINEMKSVYGKTDTKTNRPKPQWFIAEVKKGNALYIDHKQTNAWLKEVGYSKFNLKDFDTKTEADLQALQAENPTRYSIMDKAKSLLNVGKKQNEKSRVASAMSSRAKEKSYDTFGEWAKDKQREMYVNWFDKNDALHNIDTAFEQATGEKLAEKDKLYSRAASAANNARGMGGALIEGDAENVRTIAKIHGVDLAPVSLKMAIETADNKETRAKYGDWLKQHGLKSMTEGFGVYLGANRLLEMQRMNGDDYILPTVNGQQLTKEELQDFILHAPAEFKKAAKMYYQFNDNILKLLHNGGLLSEAAVEGCKKYSFYCPLMRDFSDTASADSFIDTLSNGGRGIGNVSNPLHRIGIEGSARNFINPLESTMKATAVYLNRIERNKVAQQAVQMADEAGLEDVIQPVEGNSADAKNCVFTVMFDGEKHAYKTTPDLYDPIVGYNLPAANFVLQTARMSARVLRTGATMSPAFIVRNLIRDTITAGVASRNGFIPIIDTIRGARALLYDKEFKAKYDAMGISLNTFYGSAEQIADGIDKMAGGEYKWNSPLNIIKSCVKALEKGSEFVENATRAGEFKLALDAGKSIYEAVEDAREVTLNFSRSGVTGEKINQYIPFFNACLQGGDKLYRLFRDDPHHTAVMMAKYIVLPSLALWLYNTYGPDDDRKRYEKLDLAIKNTNWILPGGIRIPKPQETGVIFGSGVEALLDIASKKDPERFGQWARIALEQFTPNFIPTIIAPIMEWQANYSFFKGKAIAGSRLQKLPDELQYYDGTSELAKGIGAIAKVSPVKIDNTVRGYTGTMGMLLVQAMDLPLGKKEGPAKKFGEQFFFRDFNVTDYNTTRYENDFYDLLDKANKEHTGYGKKGAPDQKTKSIRAAGTLIAGLRKDIQNITDRKNLNAEQKRILIDKRKARINQIAEKAVKTYSKFY